jgi:hypothetical protein
MNAAIVSGDVSPVKTRAATAAASGPPRSRSDGALLSIGSSDAPVLQSARPRVSSGWRSAKCSAMKPPAEWPNRNAGPMSSAAMSSATRSSVHPSMSLLGSK